MKKKMIAIVSAAVLAAGIAFAGGAVDAPVYEEIITVDAYAKKAAVKVKSVKFSEKSVTLKAGETYTAKVTVTPSNASNKKVKYSSSDSKVAKVSAGGTVTAVKAGSAVITAKAADGSGKSAKLNVTVTAKAARTEKKKTAGFDTKMTAADIVKDMKVGWNLGNTLDAISGNGICDAGNSSETAWGQPVTTKAMIDAIKKQGFNTVRMPVTWHDHLDKNYNVNKDWLKRVKECVDYAVDNDMYIIVNMHHDNVIYDMGNTSKSDKAYKAMEKNYLKIWSQVAEVFKDYDEHLIFESMNEPRTEGSPKEWTGGTAEERDVVNKLNAAYVKMIRKSGGNNEYRFIMLPGYAASSSTVALNDIKLPDDDRIIVSVHAYSPYNFAMNDKGSNKFSQRDKKELDDLFKFLNDKFVSKGTPVVIGEMGATNKDNLADRVEWTKYFVKGAAKYNMTCVWWDNRGFNKGAENFGIFDRITCKFKFKEIADALVESRE